MFTAVYAGMCCMQRHQSGKKYMADNNGENCISWTHIHGNSLTGMCNVQTYSQCHQKAINKVNESFQIYNRGAIINH